MSGQIVQKIEELKREMAADPSPEGQLRVYDKLVSYLEGMRASEPDIDQQAFLFAVTLPLTLIRQFLEPMLAFRVQIDDLSTKNVEQEKRIIF